jgi:hypothetical protein
VNKKKQKKLYSFRAGTTDSRAPSEKSFFASFFPKKEDSSFLPLAFTYIATGALPVPS